MSDHVKVPVDWQGVLTKEQAIKIIDVATDKDDPYWSYLVEDFYCEKTDTMPSIFHVFQALGVTKEEYKAATRAENVNWPSSAEASPEPESAEPVVCLEISNESYRFKVANQDALIALDDGEHWLYAHPLAQECEPITKYVELTREQAFEHLKTNSFHLERTGLYKLVINPDWKPSPPE